MSLEEMSLGIFFPGKNTRIRSSSLRVYSSLLLKKTKNNLYSEKDCTHLKYRLYIIVPIFKIILKNRIKKMLKNVQIWSRILCIMIPSVPGAARVSGSPRR